MYDFFFNFREKVLADEKKVVILHPI